MIQLLSLCAAIAAEGEDEKEKEGGSEDDAYRFFEGGDEDAPRSKKKDSQNVLIYGLQVITQFLAIVEAVHEGKKGSIVLGICMMVVVLYTLFSKQACIAAALVVVQVSAMVHYMFELKDAGKNDKAIYAMMWIKLLSAAAWIQLYYVFKDDGADGTGNAEVHGAPD